MQKAEEAAFDQLDEMRDFLLSQKFAKGFDVAFSFPASGGLALSTGSGALGGDADLTLSSNELAKVCVYVYACVGLTPVSGSGKLSRDITGGGVFTYQN